MSSSIMIAWPKLAAFVNIEDIVSIVSKYAIVNSYRCFNVSFRAMRIILTQVYEEEPWLGDSYHHFNGTKIKGKECWHKKGNIYLLDLKGDMSSIIKCKEIIRRLSGLGNSACHTTDSVEDYNKLIKFFNNANTMHLLSKADFFRFKGLYERIKEYRKIIADHSDDFIIASSTVMELYGLRKSRDIDFLTTDESFTYNTQEIGNHNDCLEYYSKGISELICNEDNYLYIWGVKVLTLQNLLEFKMNRGEIPKDITDIKLIKKML